MSDLSRIYHFTRCLRMVVVMVCRGGAIVLAFRGAVTLVGGGHWYYQNRPLIQAGLMPDTDAYNWLYIGMAQWAAAVPLAVFAALIARWVVPAPAVEAACLRCGYATEKLTKPICPECGAPVPLDDHSSGAPEDA